MPTSNIEFQSMELPPTEQVPGFEAEMVGDGLIYAELGTAAFILAEADAQYQAYVATLPQEQQDALAQAEADLQATDRSPLDEGFLTQPLDDAARATRAAAMDVRQQAWNGAGIKADDVLNGAKAQYYRQMEMDRIVRELIDTSNFGAEFIPSRSKKGKRSRLARVPYNWTSGSTGFPLAA